ncbi:MAG: NADH:flavin oxidoreductase, partial [Planctomycetaceae bacterium]
ACHGYLVHEFLAARRRPGPWGGDFEGRTRLLRTLVERVHAEVPGILVGVRLSLFDTIPWRHEEGRGVPMPWPAGAPYDAGFGIDELAPTRADLGEPIRLLELLRDAGVAAVNLSAGCPYSAPHVTRPAAYPPSDGYPPPEDPLVGVHRQLDAARRAREAVPGLPMIGSAYTYLQEWLPHAAQATVRAGWIDAVGIGRMVLSYPALPADVLAGRGLSPKRVCRTFSDCTTAPRQGLRSGCYPLDDHYKTLEPDAGAMRGIRRGAGPAP